MRMMTAGFNGVLALVGLMITLSATRLATGITPSAKPFTIGTVYGATMLIAGVTSLFLLNRTRSPQRWVLIVCALTHGITVSGAIAFGLTRPAPDLELLLVLPLAVPATLTWLAVKTSPGFETGHCSRCNYDLSGLTETTCPECGHPISPSTPARAAPPPPPPPRSLDPPPPPS